MSLLLDALRRAESEAKKRRLSSSGDTTASAPLAAPVDSAQPVAAATPEQYPEFTLDEYKPAQESIAADSDNSHEEPIKAQMPSSPDPLDFVLPSDDAMPEKPKPGFVSSRTREALHPYDRGGDSEPQESNWGVLTSSSPSRNSGNEEAPDKVYVPDRREAKVALATPDAAGPEFSLPATVAAPAAKPPPKRMTEAAAPIPIPMPKPMPMPMPAPVSTPRTPRQSMSAAGIMAGRKLPASFGSVRRRQLILVAVVLIVALPVAVVLIFGDAIFGSSSLVVANKAPATQPLIAAAPPPPVPDTPVSGGAVPSPETVNVVALPAVPVRVPSTAQVAPSFAAESAEPRVRAGASTSARDQAPRGTANLKTAPAVSGVTGPSLVPSPAKPVPLMELAYAAYQGGNPGEAVRLYREALKADPTQRDAWLGLAVIAHASNQREPAMDAYKRVLRLEPQNPTALAGVSSLSSGVGEPQQESRLRELLARSPQEADLNHALALVLSGEQRWSEAQPLFFKAHALAPQEPQFAYNLAVALDHLRKSSLAAQYYEVALGLTQGKSPSFNEANARSRLAALKAGTPDGVAR